MRNRFTTFTAALAFSLFAVSPGYGADNDKAEKKVAPGVGLGLAASLEDQMVGYWAPDPKSMAQKIKDQIGDNPEAEALLPIIQAAMANMAVRVKKGEVVIHVGGQARTSTYEVTKKDPATKTLTMKIVDKDKESVGTAKIDGDKLTLSKDGEDMVLKRIKKEDYEKRKAAAQQPFLPGLE